MYLYNLNWINVIETRLSRPESSESEPSRGYLNCDFLP